MTFLLSSLRSSLTLRCSARCVCYLPIAYTYAEIPPRAFPRKPGALIRNLGGGLILSNSGAFLMGGLFVLRPGFPTVLLSPRPLLGTCGDPAQFGIPGAQALHGAPSPSLLLTPTAACGGAAAPSRFTDAEMELGVLAQCFRSSQGRRGQGSPWGPFYKSINPTHRGSLSGPNPLPKAPPPNTITLGLGFSIGIFGDTNIQSRAESLLSRTLVHLSPPA